MLIGLFFFQFFSLLVTTCFSFLVPHRLLITGLFIVFWTSYIHIFFYYQLLFCYFSVFFNFIFSFWMRQIKLTLSVIFICKFVSYGIRIVFCGSRVRRTQVDDSSSFMQTLAVDPSYKCLQYLNTTYQNLQQQRTYFPCDSTAFYSLAYVKRYPTDCECDPTVLTVVLFNVLPVSNFLVSCLTANCVCLHS